MITEINTFEIHRNNSIVEITDAERLNFLSEADDILRTMVISEKDIEQLSYCHVTIFEKFVSFEYKFSITKAKNQIAFHPYQLGNKYSVFWIQTFCYKKNRNMTIEINRNITK